MDISTTAVRSPSFAARRRLAAALALGALVPALAACGDATDPEPPASSASTAASPASPDATDAVDVDSVEVPDTAVGREVSWVLGAIDPATPVTAQDAAAHLGEAASAAISGEELVVAFAQVAASGPWRVVSYTGTETEAVAAIRSPVGDELDLTVTLDEAGLVSALLFAPAFERTPATSWEELTAAVAAMPAETTLVVVDVTDPAAPSEVFAAGDEVAAPIGSVFKLYVLGAVVQAVADGTLSWDDTVTVTDALRSLPSGELQDEPAGTTVTVREAAQAMIEISDNTATDLLIDAVGRSAVEDQLVAMGHSDPGLNLPFLMTRELFWIGWGDDGAYRERWAGADEAERRGLLAELPDGPPEIATVLEEVVWPDGADWFATPADIVAAHVALGRLAATPVGEPLAQILGTNPAFAPDEVAEFDTVAFKGGSSTGELALTWRLTTSDAAWVVVLQARSEDAAATADVRPYLGAAGDAVALLDVG